MDNDLAGTAAGDLGVVVVADEQAAEALGAGQRAEHGDDSPAMGHHMQLEGAFAGEPGEEFLRGGGSIGVGHAERLGARAPLGMKRSEGAINFLRSGGAAVDERRRRFEPRALLAHLLLRLFRGARVEPGGEVAGQGAGVGETGARLGLAVGERIGEAAPSQRLVAKQEGVEPRRRMRPGRGEQRGDVVA